MTIQAIAAVLLWLLCFFASVLKGTTPAALAAGLVFGWLFLPHFWVDLPGLPELNKSTIVSFVCFGAVLTVSPDQRSGSKLTWWDLPAMLFPLTTVPASVNMGLGLYDGFSSAYTSFWVWTAPYLVGRIVFSNSQNALILARVVVFAGFVYSAFCLFEIKMSPRLHSVVYGLDPRPSQNYFTQAKRFGLWRPMVFMEHGLALAWLMSAITLVAWCGYLSGRVTHVAGISMRVVAWLLSATTVLCVSSLSILLLVAGWLILQFRHTAAARFLVLMLAVGVFAYPVSRMLGSVQVIHAANVVFQASQGELGSARAESFLFRVDNEEVMLQKWRTSPLFGSARYFRHTGEEGRATTDSFWVIMLGRYGVIGWLCWTSVLAIPACLAVFRGDLGSGRGLAESVGFALVAILFAADGLLNAMPNPICVMMAGAATGLLQRQDVASSDRIGDRQEAYRAPVVTRKPWPPTDNSVSSRH